MSEAKVLLVGLLVADSSEVKNTYSYPAPEQGLGQLEWQQPSDSVCVSSNSADGRAGQVF